MRQEQRKQQPANASGTFQDIQRNFNDTKGNFVVFGNLHGTRGKDWVSCAVKKDAGDDPDITDQLEIFAKVEKCTHRNFKFKVVKVLVL